MASLFDAPLARLAAGEVCSGVSAAPRALRVMRGCLWITLEGDRRDYWLRAGDVLALPPGCLVVAEAHRQPCLFRVDAGAVCGGARPAAGLHGMRQGGPA